MSMDTLFAVFLGTTVVCVLFVIGCIIDEIRNW